MQRCCHYDTMQSHNIKYCEYELYANMAVLKNGEAFMKYTKIKQGLAVLLVVTFMLGLGGCSLIRRIYPHAGMVSVADGVGGELWMERSKKLEPADFNQEDFSKGEVFAEYSGSDYQAMNGIDVSEHQQEIDWLAAKQAGVDFAIIRTGYRGYQKGTLQEDAFFRKNIEGALAAGIRVGVYFFSQAVTKQEAIEEAQYCISQIDSYDISLPVFYDWENIGKGEEARTDSLDGKSVTEFCLAFAETIRGAGYTPGVYFYRSQGYLFYDLDALEGLEFWSAAVGDYPDFYYRHSFWQYSFTGKVAGIDIECDLNMMLLPAEKQK